METRDARSLSSSAQEELRRRAAKAVLGGKSQSEAAKLFGVSRQTVNEWVQAYRQVGDKALRSKRKGRPVGGSLSRLPWKKPRYSGVMKWGFDLTTPAAKLMDAKDIHRWFQLPETVSAAT